MGAPDRRDPRNNPEDAYQAFMSMPNSEWNGLIRSLFHGGVLTTAEQVGFDRAIKNRAALNGPNGPDPDVVVSDTLLSEQQREDTPDMTLPPPAEGSIPNTDLDDPMTWTVSIERPDGVTLVWQVQDTDLYASIVGAIIDVTGHTADVVGA
jgi:hypothetical protein